MGLSSGARLGPYEIVSPLGAGGMGEAMARRLASSGARVAIVDLTTRAALAEQVIDDHVGPVPSEERREHRGLGCQDTPRLRELAVQVDRRVDLDGAKHFGKCVHGASLLPVFRLIGQVRKTGGQELRIGTRS